MAHVVSTALLSNALENSVRKAGKSPYSCKTWRFISSISSWGTTSSHLKYSDKNPHFSDNYVLGEKLGTGSFSTVRIGIQKELLKIYAIKIINKDMLVTEK